MKYAAASDIKSNCVFSEWEGKSKLIAFTLLIFSFALVKNILLVPLMLTVSGILFMISGITWQLFFHRLRVPGVFIILTSLFILLFSSGQVIFSAGLLSITVEGIQGMVLLISRVTAIITLLLILFETTPLMDIVYAMRALGLPLILADMLLFTVRYLYTLEEQLQQMRIALTLRGFKGNSIKDWKNFAILIGAVLLRSYDQSDRVYRALTVRGYGASTAEQKESSGKTRDQVLSGSFIITAVFIGFVQILLGYPGW